MKRLSTGMLAALFVALCGLSAVAAPSTATQGNTGNGVAQTGSAPPANFGTPPSGQIPILYNDHHVYTKPDVLKQGRVLAALVKGGTILIPLRSMFEQMGATVSYDAGSKTATVSQSRRRGQGDRRQAGSHDQRRIASAGRAADDLSRQRARAGARHLRRHGRVRAVGSGQATGRRAVHSRDAAARSGRRPRRPRRRRRRRRPDAEAAARDSFVAGDYIISPKVYNEFASPGNQGNSSFAIRGGGEFDASTFRGCSKARTNQLAVPARLQRAARR